MNIDNEIDKPRDAFRCGYTAIIGRPNVGKSTLLNRLMGQKISITSRKPQTTQRRILGINTSNDYQLIYVDTPGIQNKYQDAINLFMRKEINTALAHLDALIFMVEALKWMPADEEILSLVDNIKVPVLLLINKVDKIKDRDRLLPFIQARSLQRKFEEIIPVSASKNINIEQVEKVIASLMPIAAAEFPEDQMTDRSERFIVAEFIREKLIQKLGMELPYRVTVTIERFVYEDAGVVIDAEIWVETENQKSIVIGKDGGVLKIAGEQSRKDIEKLLGSKVFLRTWVKVRKNWSDDRAMLKQFGFDS